MNIIKPQLITTQGNADPGLADSGLCMVAYNGMPCPEPYTGVIENLNKPGFSKVCERHRQLWIYSTENMDTGCKLWSREEWESTGREAEVKKLIAETEEA